MIRPASPPRPGAVAHHYDELDPFYRALWGEHLHHGLWTTGRESPEEAVRAMLDEVARRAGIGPGSRVCDVGSGYGAPALRLAARGARITGLTLSPAQHRYAVDAARRRGTHPAPEFLLRDWLDNRLPDARFDAVIAIESLTHMADPAAAFAEAFRVLRPGGRFVGCLWMAAENPPEWAVRHLLRPICDEGRLYGLPQPSDLGRWLAGAGFAEPDLQDVGHRVAPTWTVSSSRVGRALFRPSSWRYLTDSTRSERRFAVTVARMLAAHRVGAMRYGIVSGTRPAS